MQGDLLTYALVVFTSFFTIINPLGTMPVFMTMTQSLSPESRRKTAQKAVLVSFATLILFGISGELLFEFFGISVNALRIVGGIIFFLMGQDMLQARLAKTKVTEDEVKSYVNDISITPLAIPMIAGPGAITNIIVMWKDTNTVTDIAVLLGGLSVVMILTFLILWSAGKIMNLLGETGRNVLMRLMGLIVMVIAVEFFFSGLIPIIKQNFMM
jgi:multiple antibiotic resistance protein